MGIVLTTSYEENLPSANFKTRRFGRTIMETLPEECSTNKELFLKAAERQQAMCEFLVKNDLTRATKEITGA